MGSKAVLILPWGPPGQVRVEVYSPDGDDQVFIDADLAPDLIHDGERWGQDNLVEGSHPGVERVWFMVLPDGANADVEVAKQHIVGVLDA